MSPTLSINRQLQETEAPTLDEDPEEAVSEGGDTSPESGNMLFSLFKTREHETTAADTTLVDAAEGRRHLLVISDEASLQDPLKSFDPISVLDNQNAGSSYMESLSRGEDNDASVEGKAESRCPTQGPSVVPRRIEELAVPSIDEDRRSPSQGGGTDMNLSNDTDTTNVANHTKHSPLPWPGRARHTQHQFVQLDSTTSLDSSSVKIPTRDEAKKRRLLVNYSEDRANLRLVFDTSSLIKLIHEMGQNFNSVDLYKPTKARIEAYTETVFPSVVETWGMALQINSALDNIIVPHAFSTACGVTPIPEEHLNEGVADSDVLIYVGMRDEASCSIDSRPQITVCHFDQQMRPLIGSLSICLDEMTVQQDNVYANESLRHTALISQLVGRFLGLSPNLFKYFRDPETGQLWGERKVEVSCSGVGIDVDSQDEVKQEIMISNIIQELEVRDESSRKWEISSPRVKQVVRNHFDCQTLRGARLAAPTMQSGPEDGSSECTFFDLDLRYHFDEDMTAISHNADAANRVSPLSLALLEDSSWYKANFFSAATPTFGRGAGCGFVESSCISRGNVPDYAEGYFCATAESPGSRSGCDYTHHHKAGCNLDTDAGPPEEYQYFLDPQYGAEFDDMDYCPMRSKHLVPCSSSGGGEKHLLQQLDGESFEESSRCFETDANVPVCLEAVCNPEDKTLSIIVQGKVFYCAFHGQVINVDVGFSVICPRIAAVCPELVCPSNCSGAGVCDYCKEVPKCICNSPYDQTDGCWDS